MGARRWSKKSFPRRRESSCHPRISGGPVKPTIIAQKPGKNKGLPFRLLGGPDQAQHPQIRVQEVVPVAFAQRRLSGVFGNERPDDSPRAFGDGGLAPAEVLGDVTI